MLFRSSSKEDQKTAAAAFKAKQGKRKPAEATTLPPDWQPSESHAELAKRQQLTLAYQAEAFRAHAEATGRLAQSWNGAFATWLLKGDPEKEPRHVRTPQVEETPMRAPAGALLYAKLKAEGKIA